jgi:hypothetical protein
VELPPTADGAVPFYFLEGNISHDGSVIVGAARGGLHANSLGNSMFIWDPIHGSRNLKQLLIEEYRLGPALTGWTIPRGLWFGVSGDGRTIYGDGLNPLGQQEGWIAYLGSPVPEPSALLLAGIVLTMARTRKRVSISSWPNDSSPVEGSKYTASGDQMAGSAFVQQMGEEILEYCIKAASGEVIPKAVQLNQDDFIPWKRGVSL